MKTVVKEGAGGARICRLQRSVRILPKHRAPLQILVKKCKLWPKVAQTAQWWGCWDPCDWVMSPSSVASNQIQAPQRGMIEAVREK